MARKELNEVEERIIAWAQLSGLTAKDFVRIGARIRRNEKIKERETALETEFSQYKLEKFQKGWLFTGPKQTFKEGDKKIIGPVKAFISRISSWPSTWEVQVLNNDGYAFTKTKITTTPGYTEYQYPNRIFPGQNKHLYAVLRMIINGNLNWTDINKKVKVLDGNVA